MTYIWNLSEDMPTKQRSMAFHNGWPCWLDQTERDDIGFRCSQEEPSGCSNPQEEMKLHGLEQNYWNNLTLNLLRVWLFNLSNFLFIGGRHGNAAPSIAFVFLLAASLYPFASRLVAVRYILVLLWTSIRSQNVVAKHEATGELC